MPCFIPNCFTYEELTAPTSAAKDAGGQNTASVNTDSRIELPIAQSMNDTILIVEDEHVAEEARAKTYFLGNS